MSNCPDLRTESERELVKLRASVASLVEKWRDRLNDPEYQIYKDGLILCADELEAAFRAENRGEMS